MRFASVMAAVAALWMQPAGAVTFEIAGTARGATTGIEPCSVGQCVWSEPFEIPFGFHLTVGQELTQVGDLYSFFFGTGGGFWSGSFRYIAEDNSQSILARYSRFNIQCLDDSIPRRECDTTATSENFRINQIDPAPVPEPAIWAMMLFGFGAIGAAMRRGQVQSLRSRYLIRSTPW